MNKFVKTDTRVLDEMIRLTPAKVQQFRVAAATSIVNDIVLSFGTSPDGETHIRQGRMQVASQPGYPPNIDTGDLRASIHWEQVSETEIHIKDGVYYGFFLERGTSEMADRPFMLPVIEEWAKSKLGILAKGFFERG